MPTQCEYLTDKGTQCKRKATKEMYGVNSQGKKVTRYRPLCGNHALQSVKQGYSIKNGWYIQPLTK